MNQKHLLMITTIAAGAAAVYLYVQLNKCKTYIKSLPEPANSSDGMPPHTT